MVQEPLSLDVLAPEPGHKHRGCGSCGSGETGSACGNGLEKIYPTTAVRFGYLRYIGEFTHTPDLKFTCGAQVVIQTRRGLEMGEQVSLTCNGCDRSVSRDQMRAWVETCGHESFVFDAGRILREATAADLAEYAHIQADNRPKRDFCRRLAAEHKLPMKVVECETPFGGERLIYYFISEERVDFRDLVRDLAAEYRTRIEMRQIGARDEARLLADYETCGREVCCKVFLKTLRPITMRMAKLQKATLDPSQVSGRCGRLKCCLRFEHVGYEELERRLPKTGVRIRTNHGEGVVVNRQTLTQLVQIRKDDGSLVTVVMEDVTAVGVPAPAPGATPAESPPSRAPRPPRGRPDRARPRPRLSDIAPAVPDAATPTPEGGETAESPTDQPSDPPRPPRSRRRRSRRRGHGPEDRPGNESAEAPDSPGPSGE